MQQKFKFICVYHYYFLFTIPHLHRILQSSLTLLLLLVNDHALPEGRMRPRSRT